MSVKVEEQSITYLKGDATSPVGSGTKIIVHCCNNIGAWGAGFVTALSARWPGPEESYREWDYNDRQGIPQKTPFGLGQIQLVPVASNLWVCNLIGQEGVGAGFNKRPPIRYDAIDCGLKKLAEQVFTAVTADGKIPSVHMPRMGAGLAGGDWDVIEALVKSNLSKKGIEVFVYDFV